MKKLLLSLLLVVGCATVSPETEVREYNPNGTPRPLKSEMALGAQLCEQKCRSYGRHIQQYEPSGDCDCAPITYGNQPVPH